MCGKAEWANREQLLSGHGARLDASFSQRYLSLLHLGADQTPFLLQQGHALLRLRAGAGVVAVEQHQPPLGQQLAVDVLLGFELAVQLLQRATTQGLGREKLGEGTRRAAKLRVMGT